MLSLLFPIRCEGLRGIGQRVRCDDNIVHSPRRILGDIPIPVGLKIAIPDRIRIMIAVSFLEISGQAIRCSGICLA